MKKNTKFKVGQTVVHLSHGIGKIIRREQRELSPGKVTEYFILEIEDNGAPKKVFVPVDSAVERMRLPVADTTKVWNALKADAEPVDQQTWNRRYRDYMERLHSGDAVEIARVLRALFALRDARDLSFGERKLLDCAKGLIIKELAASENTSEAAIKSKLEAIFF